MIVIDRRVLKKLEQFREHLHLEDSVTESDFLSAGWSVVLVYVVIELYGRYWLLQHGMTTIFFDQLWWVGRIVMLSVLARRCNKRMPHKTITVVIACTATWGMIVGIIAGLEKALWYRDLANVFLIPAEALALFVLGSAIAYMAYRVPLSLLYKHEEN